MEHFEPSIIRKRSGDGLTTARFSVVISRIFASDQRSLACQSLRATIADDNGIENLLTKSSKRGERRRRTNGDVRLIGTGDTASEAAETAAEATFSPRVATTGGATGLWGCTVVLKLSQHPCLKSCKR